MDEVLQEFVSSQGVAVRVDRAQGVIRGVKLLGLASRNGRRYLPAALDQAAALYEGAKVNVNHPKGNPLAARDYQDRLGVIRAVQARGDGLFGDLHFNPKHALAEQLAWDAEHAPENVGLSHNVEARTARQGDQTVVEAILKVQSVDLVADPATTHGLFESAPPDSAAVSLAEATLEQVQAQRGDLVEALLEEPRAETAALRAELEALRARESSRERRAAAIRLLREYRLPDPDAAACEAQPLVSQVFFETLLAADDEAAMRVLVRERAQLIEAARLAGGGQADRRPLSREQQRTERLLTPIDGAKAFALAIS